MGGEPQQADTTDVDERAILAAAVMAHRGISALVYERDQLHRTLKLVREQRDAFHAQSRSLSARFQSDPPCGDGRCYCGGCVL